jgi:hypothetical protein
MVWVGSYYFIYFYSDPNPTHLNSGQKIMTHTRSDRVTGQLDPTSLKQLINYLLFLHNFKQLNINLN